MSADGSNVAPLKPRYTSTNVLKLGRSALCTAVGKTAASFVLTKLYQLQAEGSSPQRRTRAVRTLAARMFSQ